MFADLILWAAKNWRVLAAAGVLAAVLAFGWYLKRQIWQDGFKTCQMENAAEFQKLVDHARPIIVEKGKEYEKTIQNLTRAGETGDGVGRRTADILDRLHERTAR